MPSSHRDNKTSLVSRTIEIEDGDGFETGGSCEKAPQEPITVRWITLDLALDKPRLSDIDPDPNPIPCDTTLYSLKELAHSRACKDTNAEWVECYLADCYLSGNDATLVS
jgi:hypothetical protein